MEYNLKKSLVCFVFLAYKSCLLMYNDAHVHTVYVLFSALAIFTKEHDTTSPKMYAVCSLSYLGAMLASNQSLQYISYPTQVTRL